MNSVHDTIMGKIELAQEAQSGGTVRKHCEENCQFTSAQEAQSGSTVKKTVNLHLHRRHRQQREDYIYCFLLPTGNLKDRLWVKVKVSCLILVKATEASADCLRNRIKVVPA
ncbi:hypothetical protein BaRGS_00033061 [Batillaria attramentaria]|uniref:Uncharacterized protein n=1 Tax=Batillaria attramentaria TaxID=370345 RepID=A0ABD0JLW6_9CAEN